MASYIKLLKEYAIDPSISDEEFIRKLFSPYITAGHILGKNKVELDLDKTRVSKLLSRKDDVPKAMKKALSYYHIWEKSVEGFTVFVEDELMSELLPELIQRLYDELAKDSNVSITTRAEIHERKDEAVFILQKAFFEAVRINNRLNDYETDIIWQQGVNSLCIGTGDLFHYGFGNRSKQKNIVVIPVNTGFDTQLTYKLDGTQIPIVSPRTVHGQWLQRWEQAHSDMNSISEMIMSNLSGRAKLKDEAYHKSPNHGIGTIAVVNDDNAVYYLLAISEFNENNIANSSDECIKKAVSELLEFYNRFGEGLPLYLPLIGTGRSRAGLSYNQSLSLLKEVILNNSEKLQGRITIVITEDAMKGIATED